MNSLTDLVLSDHESVEAVGWLGGSSTPRSLQVSPSWRRDRQIQVAGGSVDVYPADDAVDLTIDETAVVRVVGEWRGNAIHKAHFVAASEADSVDKDGGRTPDGPPGSRMTIPTPSENDVLGRLLTAGDISWHRVYDYPDGRRTVRVGSDRRGAVQSELSENFPDGVEITDCLWSGSDLTNALSVLAEHHKSWHIIATGGGFRRATDGVFGIAVEVLHVQPDFARWADSLPAGLLDVTVLVRPTYIRTSSRD
jgi:hypothetical protein